MHEGWPAWCHPTELLLLKLQKVNDGSDGNVSEYTVFRSLLSLELHSRRPVRVMAMLTPVHPPKAPTMGN